MPFLPKFLCGSRRTFLLWSALLACAGGCHSQPAPLESQAQAPSTQQPEIAAKRVAFRIVKSYPHDSGAFTEGLLWQGSALYESTGLKEKSSLRRVDLETGEVLQQRLLSADVFGEGLALVEGRLIQLSWQNQRAFVYDAKTFAPLSEWNYSGEGWGLTFDGKSLIMSDGTEFLTWRNPKTFDVEKRVAVTFNGKPLKNINELEWIDGEVWANVWQTDIIVRIDPQSGAVKEYLDCTGLLGNARRGGEDVLNGIAYDVAKKRIFITGKFWPRLFEIALQN